MPANSEDISDMGSLPGLERSSGGVYSNPLQYSCLEKPMDRGAWWTTIHRVTKSWTRLKQLSTLASFEKDTTTQENKTLPFRKQKNEKPTLVILKSCWINVLYLCPGGRKYSLFRTQPCICSSFWIHYFSWLLASHAENFFHFLSSLCPHLRNLLRNMFSLKAEQFGTHRCLVSHNSSSKFLKRWEYQTTLSASWEICMQVKKQQLDPDMEQCTGS